MKRVVLALMLGSLLLIGTIAHAAPKKSPSGTGGASATCWADPAQAEMGSSYHLVARGLPTDTPLNVGVTTDGQESIAPFGMSVTGSESFDETATSYGWTTYRFYGPMRGTTKVYAECSMRVV